MHFEYQGITEEELYQFSEALNDSVLARIRRGMDVNDTPAPPLASKGKRGGYAGQKARRGLNPIRDLTFTGRTLRAIAPVVAGENQVSIGITNQAAIRVIASNNARSKQYGASPTDRANLIAAIRNSGIQLAKVVRDGSGGWETNPASRPGPLQWRRS
jgi:hypothetical protein